MSNDFDMVLHEISVRAPFHLTLRLLIRSDKRKLRITRSVERSDDDDDADLVERRGGEGKGKRGKADGYHADALTYALIACTGSPSCAFRISVALTLDNSNSATCCENEEPGLGQHCYWCGFV